MKASFKFYFYFLGLLATGFFLSAYDHTETQKELEQVHDNKEYSEEKIDLELFEIFHKFFDKDDKTAFTTIINKIVSLLKIKKELLQGTQKSKCAEIIKTFEGNKYNYNFAAWARIILNTNQDLQSLMSEKTRTYINKINTQTKIQALIAKLQQK